MQLRVKSFIDFFVIRRRSTCQPYKHPYNRNELNLRMDDVDQDPAYTLELTNAAAAISNCSMLYMENGLPELNYSLHWNESSCGNLSDTIYTDDVVPHGDIFQFIILGIGISIVAILGIIGNALSAVVLSRPQMKSSVTCLLLGLTFCDTLLISISFFTYSMPFMSPFIRTAFLNKYSLVYYPLWVPYLFPISITAQTASVYLTVAVTIERYIAVCHSLRARSICTWRRARICVATVLSFSIIYNLPRWFEVITYPAGIDEQSNITIYVNAMSEMRKNRTYIKFYINWAYLIIMYLIPFSGLVVFNFAIYRQVRKANKERAQLSKLQKREMGLASMLLIVVVVFLLCNILPLVNNILESIWGMETGHEKLIALSNFLVVFNSSVNFVIYCTCGERFRRLLIRLCRDFVWCRLGGRRGSMVNGFYRKSHYYRSQHGGDLEEVSLASMANHTCITTNGGAGNGRNGTVLVDISGEKPNSTRSRERNKTIPIVHKHNRHINGNGQNGKSQVDRRVSPSGPT